jgi:hypothetical protein
MALKSETATSNRVHPVARPVAGLSAVPPGGERHQVGSDQCGRCHFGGPNRVGDLASGQPAALVKQFDRKLVKLRSASARGRGGHLALVRTMTEKAASEVPEPGQNGLLRSAPCRPLGASGQIRAPFPRLIIQATRPTAIANAP